MCVCTNSVYNIHYTRHHYTLHIYLRCTIYRPFLVAFQHELLLIRFDTYRHLTQPHPTTNPRWSKQNMSKASSRRETMVVAQNSWTPPLFIEILRNFTPIFGPSQNVWSHTPWNDKPHLAQQIEAPKHCRQCPEKRRRSYWSVLPKCMSSLGHFFGDLNGTWLQFTKQNQWQDILLMEEPCTTWHI